MGRRRPPAQNPDETEIDSAQQEFGNEYSEDTLNIIRGIERPPYLEETSSLDPVEDLDLYVEHGLQIPPKAYDALQEAGIENLKDLQAVQEHVADPATVDTVRYRQALTQGASHQDMTWLKLRAYHRAMDQLSAANKKDQSDANMELLKAYEVPTDKIPADLLSMGPEQLAERQRLALQAKAVAAVRAKKAQSAAQRILAQPDPSEESEWVAQPPPRTGLTNAAKLGVLQAVCEHQGGLQLVPTVQEPTAPGPKNTQHAKPGKGGILGGRTWEKRTTYTQAYLDQLALNKRVRTQQRQRSAAFWLSFAAVSGACLLRFLRRKKTCKPTTKASGAKLQPHSSVTGSAGSRQL